MKILLSIGLLFLTSPLFAGDRFGNARLEIPRSSFTNSADGNVQIASAGATQWESGYGGIILKSIECSGPVSSTITVFNVVNTLTNFDGLTSTKTAFQYTPTIPGASNSMRSSVFISSALSYNKTGAAPCTIGWDYTVIPKSVNIGANE